MPPSLSSPYPAVLRSLRQHHRHGHSHRGTALQLEHGLMRLYPSQFSTLNGSASEHDGTTAAASDIKSIPARTVPVLLKSVERDGSLEDATTGKTTLSGRLDVAGSCDGAADESATTDGGEKSNGAILNDRYGRVSTSKAHQSHTKSQNTPAVSSAFKTTPGFLASHTLQLGGIGESLTEADIRRLMPRKLHLPTFKDRYDIVEVIPFRDEQTLERRPFYQLTFESPAAAKHFAESNAEVFNKPPEEWPRNVPFPPGAQPDFAVLDQRSSILTRTRVMRQRVFLPHAGPGRCVLLSVKGPAPAGGGKHRRPPKTEEVWKMMESKEIKLCDLRSRRKGLGVVKIEEEGITIPSSAMALLRKWIVRCYDEDEAQRVVREFHMSRPWEPSECILLAEVIY